MMKNLEYKKTYALLAGVCCGIYGIYETYTNIIRAMNGGEYYRFSTDFLGGFLGIALIGMAITLFLKNEKIVIAAAGLSVFFDFNYLASCGFRVHFYGFDVIFNCIAHVSLIFLLLLTLKKNNIVKKIWFIAGVSLLLSCLCYFYVFYFRWSGFSSYIRIYYIILNFWRNILVDLVAIAGFTLIGLWAKEHDFVSSKIKPTNEYSKFSPETVCLSQATGTAIGGADKLKTYTELLQSGIITQEEFETKKKQILGL